MYMRISASTTIHVPSHTDLLAAWRLYGHTGLIGSIEVDKPLTPAQLRRLPVDLRELLR